MTMRIEEILTTVRIEELPHRSASKVSPSTTLGEVYRVLDEEGSVAVLVYDDTELVGIFTERDVLNRTALEAERSTPISELMTREVVTLSRKDRLADAIRIMTGRRIRHVPLIDDGDDREEVALIGGRDVLRLIAQYYPETFLNLPPHLHQTMTRPEGG